MQLIIAPAEVPLHVDSHDVVRVGHTRVTLDTVIGAFLAGDPPNDIVSHYPSLSLAEVYAVIAYYLQQREQVDSYLEKRRVQAERIRREIERRHPPSEVRERLLRRRQALDDRDNSSTG